MKKIACLICNGQGYIKRYGFSLGRYYSVECQACKGTGKQEVRK